MEAQCVFYGVCNELLNNNLLSITYRVDDRGIVLRFHWTTNFYRRYASEAIVVISHEF